jgi:23S rRNA-/tRNA-specific pseudouridylate synthase
VVENQKGKEMKKTYVVQRNSTTPPEPADWQEMIWTQHVNLAKEWVDWQQDYYDSTKIKYNYRIVTMVPTIE